MGSLKNHWNCQNNLKKYSGIKLKVSMWPKMETASKCLLITLETQICIWTSKLSYFSAAGHETPHTASTKYVRIANNIDQINEFWWFTMRQFKKLPSPAVCPALLPEITAPNRIDKIGGMCASQQKPFLSAGVLSKCYQFQFLLTVLAWVHENIIAPESFASSSLSHLPVEAIGGGKVRHHF